MTLKATAQAGSNIAFVKYWGNRDDELRIPMNGSISMTLDAAHTVTTVEFLPELAEDLLILNEETAGATATKRAAKQLNHLRTLAKVGKMKARIVSSNSFPTGAGIASSASGFAALTVAAAAALELDLSAAELTKLARLGSGSASRSIDGGFVEWQPGSDHDSSFATPLAPADHWDLVDIIAIVSQVEKEVGSSAGHPLAHTSPFYPARLTEVEKTLVGVRQAILDRDMSTFGELIEAEAISLHVAAMTSRPSILYWGPGSLEIMHALRLWRANGGPTGYFTIDAGPNIHVIAERKEAEALVNRLEALPHVERVMLCGIGGPASVLSRE